MTISQPTMPRVPRVAMFLGFAAGILMILNAGAWLLVGNIWNDPAPFAL